MTHVACSEPIPCLWKYEVKATGDQEQDTVMFRWSSAKNLGTIEQVNMQIVPLEEDWIEFQFLAGKAPKYTPVEEVIETLLGEPLPPLILVPESGGGMTWTSVPTNIWNPFHPNNPWFPWNPGGGCKHSCGTPDNPVNPAPVPIPAGAFLLPVAMVALYLVKKCRKQGFTSAA